ncbi:MAG: GFA family protein [Nannocystaceae bacterium]
MKFSAQTAETFAACHCKMCQRWSSGMFMGAHATMFKITQGAEAVSTYKSSAWAERSFCKVCGSNLYYSMNSMEGVSVGLGLFDSVEGLTCENEYFVDLRLQNLAFTNKTNAMTSAEIKAKFGLG